MTSEKKPYDLKSIEPLAPPPEVDEAEEQRDRADRVGFAAAAAAGSTPAVGIAAERMDEELPASSSETPPDGEGEAAERDSVPPEVR